MTECRASLAQYGLKINNSKHTTVYQEEFKIPKGGNQNPYIEEEQTHRWCNG
jgi:hypothetical protein